MTFIVGITIGFMYISDYFHYNSFDSFDPEEPFVDYRLKSELDVFLLTLY